MIRRLLLIENDLHTQGKIKEVIGPGWEISVSEPTVTNLHQVLKNPEDFGLIICDIHLSDGFCFSAFEGKEIQTPVIFLADNEKFAIRAFDYPCIDYILKPLLEERLIKAFKKLDFWSNLANSEKYPEEPIEKIFNPIPKRSYKKRFLIKSGTRLSLVPVEDVAYFIAEEGITFLVAAGSSQRYMVNHSLNELESGLLDPEKFYRINRSVIINLDNLVEMKPYHNGRLALSLNAKTEEVIVVARERVNEFKAWINQ